MILKLQKLPLMIKKILKYMLLAKEENAAKTYAELKDEYLALKALSQVSGVNLSDIDKIKEKSRNNQITNNNL